MNKRRTRRRRRVVPGSTTQPFPLVNPNAAAIDLGSRSHYVAVPESRDPQPVQQFGCYTPELERLAQWLKKCGIDTVAMESTGVYWVPVYEVLEQHGLKPLLADARQVKNLSGRKSDVDDCQWIRHLHSYGLLTAAFRPKDQICQVRSYWRQRRSLVQSASRQIQLMQKALEQMNVQLHKAVSDITGRTGMSIIRAIVGGERDPQTLACLRKPGIKSSKDELAQALTGNYREEHIFALTQALETYDFTHRQVQDCDHKVEAAMKCLPGKPSATAASPAPPQKRRKNQPHFDLRAEQIRIAGVDLTRVPGLDTLTAQAVLTEVGPELTRFSNEKKFASWITVCPNNRKTGGKIRSRHTRKSSHPLADSFRVAAQSLHHSKSALGAYYRRMRGRLGPAKAITAVAHKLARLVYRMLKYGEEYVEQGLKTSEAHYQRRALKNTKRQARQMGYALMSLETGELLG